MSETDKLIMCAVWCGLSLSNLAWIVDPTGEIGTILWFMALWVYVML